MNLDRRQFVAAAGLAAILPARVARAQSGSIDITIRLTDRRVLVDCNIAGSGPHTFVMDTGGTIGLLQLDLARSLRLKKLRDWNLDLLQGRRAYPIYEATDLVFGGLLRQPSAAFAGVDNVGFGDDAVGSLAAGTLTSVDSELDFDHSLWRIHRTGAPDRNGWTRFDDAIVPYGNRNGSPFLYADAEIAGRTIRFGLDTGMPQWSRFYRKTAEAIGLWDSPRWSPAGPGGRGRLVRAPRITIAGSPVEGSMVLLQDEADWGAFPNGILGLPLLRLFNVATDSRGKAVFLRRNAVAPPTARYNMVGIWVDRAGQDIVISSVGAGSPAAAAGLTSGDRILGTNFDDLIRAMGGPAGTTIPLKIASGGTTRDITLTATDYL